ncbi:hypothetical protein [Gynuella sp.]|uniref:hypothetical protein n=1 Tax=Gynuella sp. TaxID=2969146 RepID=UPI003D0DDD40
MKAINIKTELGNEILASLIKLHGWRVKSEYSKLAFDKGIDFDSYILEKEGVRLEFEWTNWFEWEISGSIETLQELAKNYGFELNLEKDS